MTELLQTTGLASIDEPPVAVAACELVLEGLVAQKRISRNEELGYTRAGRRAG